jgi:hypothetical protein
MTALFGPPSISLGIEATATEPEPPARSATELFRGLLRSGLSPDQAGNLTARLLGLSIGRSRAWTVHELEHIVFLRTLADSGRLELPAA